MPANTLTVGQGANSFTHNGTTYGPGSQFQTDDPCEALAFAQSFAAANPEGGRRDDSPGAWETTEAACPAGTGTTPGTVEPQTAPDVDPASQGGDSAQAQGAPAPTGPQIEGRTTDPPPQQDPPPTEEPRRPPAGELDPAQVRETPNETTLVSDPVDIFSGAYFARESDLEIPNTILPLAFVRSYRSGVPVFGPFGWNWDHNFNMYVRELSTGDVALWRSLHEDIFTFDGVRFEPPRGIFEQLERVPGLAQVWEVLGAGGTVMRFERPPTWVDGERIPLVRIADRHGNALHLTYGERDHLVEVRDDDGRFLHFDYDACGLLVAVSDHAGRRYVYGHDEETFHLQSVTTPPTTDHPDGLTRVYFYADAWAPPELRHNIVRIEDAYGQVFLENRYDDDPASLSFARVTEQLFGSYLYQYRYTPLQWVPPSPLFVNVPALQAEVMNPDYGVETYTFNFRGDLLDERFRLVKDGSFRIVAIQYEYDEQGNLVSTTRPDGSQELNTYEPANPDPRMRGLRRQRELVAAAGFPAPSRIVWRGRYDPTWQLIVEEIAENGATTTYDYDVNLSPGAPTNSGKLKRVRHPDATLPDGTIQTSATEYEHAANGVVTAVIEPDGTRTELAYGTAGSARNRLARRTRDAAGLAIVEEYEYDAAGYLAVTIDGNGNRTTKAINALGQVERVTLPAIGGQVAGQGFHYDRDRRVSAFERPRGSYDDTTLGGALIVDEITRDILGHPIEMRLGANTATLRTIRSQHDHRGFPLRTINPDGSRIDRVYDERGRLVRETFTGADGVTQTAREVYDRTGNRTRSIEPGGATTFFEYDGFGRMQEIVAPSGTTVQFSWGEGDVVQSVRVTGADDQGTVRLLAESRFEYDERLRRTAEIARSFDDDSTLAIDVTTIWVHDEADRLVRIVDHLGGGTTHAYDGLGRLVSTVDPADNEERRAYDANGNVIATERHDREPDGTVAIVAKAFAYDTRNRQTTETAPDGSQRTTSYDDRDLPVTETDALGNVTEIAYDAFGIRTRETIDPAGLAIVHRWEHDVHGRTTAYVDPTGEVSTYALDGLGRSVLTTYPNGMTSQRTFNAAGNVATERVGSGATFAYEYDAANRLTRMLNTATPAGLAPLPDHRFAYDGFDRLTGTTVGTEEVRRRFDSRGRLRAERAHGLEMTCAYDDASGTMEVTWPDGRTEQITMDANDRPERIDETAPGTLGSGGGTIATLAYSGPDRLGAIAMQGRLALAAAYDDRKRLVELAATSPAGLDESIQYRYDALDRVRIESIDGVAPSMRYLEHDAAARLTQVGTAPITALPPATTQPQHDAAIAAASGAATPGLGFAYDDADARVKATEAGQPDIAYANAPGHRPTSAGPETFTYNADGVRATDGSFTYATDCLGRIVQVQAGAAAVCAIAYDGLGRPSLVQEQGRPDRTLSWFGEHLVQESTGTTAVLQRTIHPGTASPLAFHVNGATLYPVFDGRASLVALADTAGNLVETHRYAPFGAPTVLDATGAPIPGSAVGIDPIFGGQRHLPSNGLYLSTRRLMDPRHGVFLSPDPLGFATSASLYAYAGQDPFDRVDPDGELAFLAILAVMAVGAVVAGGINATRQGIQMAENPARRAQGFSWGELGLSMGIGAVLAPVLVVAPELIIPLAAVGVAGGANEMANGNYATGTFDIVTSVVPFGSRNVRTSSLGRGTYIGQWRGQGPAASWNTRVGRFDAIQQNLGPALRPSPFGRRIGIGFARQPGDTRGHSGVVVDEGAGLTLFHKNGQHTDMPGWQYEASWQIDPSPLPTGYPLRPGQLPIPWEYHTIRMPRAMAEAMSGYARGRMGGREEFAFGTRSCGNFTSDVFNAGGIRGMASSEMAGGVFRNFMGFIDARNAASMSYGAGFWANMHQTVPNRKCAPGE